MNSKEWKRWRVLINTTRHDWREIINYAYFRNNEISIFLQFSMSETYLFFHALKHYSTS